MKINDKNMTTALSLIIIGLYLRNVTFLMTIFDDNLKNNISLMIRLLILFPLILSIPVFLKRINTKFLVIIFISIVLIGLHYVIFPKNNIYFVNTLESYVLIIFPGILVSYFLVDFNLLYNKLIKTSMYVSLINVFVFIFFLVGLYSSDNVSYSMGFSLSLLIPTNFLVAKLVSKRTLNFDKILTIILILLNLLTMLVFGSRGAIVSVLFFILISFILFIQNKKQKTIYIFAISISLIFIILLSGQIIEVVGHILSFFGISSRNLLLINSNNFLDDSNRFIIWEAIWNDFLQNPFMLRGINSDYFVQTGLSTVDYSHNLFIEIFHSFGLIFGLVLSSVIIAKIVKTFNLKIDNFSMVKLVFLSGFFPLLLWSGSLWTNSSFWIWLSFRNPSKKKIKHGDIK